MKCEPTKDDLREFLTQWEEIKYKVDNESVDRVIRWIRRQLVDEGEQVFNRVEGHIQSPKDSIFL